MRDKNTNIEKRISTLLSLGNKVLFIFLCLFIFQSSLAKSIGPDIIDSEPEITAPQDSTLVDVANNSQAIIYISSGVSISNLDTEINYRIVKVSTPKKSITSTPAKTENKKKAILKPKSAKPELVQTHPQSIEILSSGSESDVAFSIQQNHNIAFAQTQNPVLKHLIRSGFYFLQIAVLDATQTKTPNDLVHFCGKIDADSHSVRPPPALF